MSKNKFVSSLSKVFALAMGVVVVATPLMACNGDGESKPSTNKRDNENEPLVLASDILDGAFNPFFYTSGNDGEVVGQTQIGMLSSDKDGQLVANWDEPCVSHAFSTVTTGSISDRNDSAQSEDEKYAKFYTDYYFALKDNIKFSDGTPLTKEDVLFNMYMYLDPAYTGSSTMYSVNIRGLQAYRSQTTNANEETSSNEYFDSLTDARVNNLINWANNGNITASEWDYLRDYIDDYGDKSMYSDVLKIHELFRDELKSDWTYAMGADVKKDYEQFKDENGEVVFNYTWEVFLYNYGIVKTRREYKDISDKSSYYYVLENDYCGDDHKSCGNKHDEETLVNYVYSKFFGEFENNSAVKSYKSSLLDVLMYYATASKYIEYARAQIMAKEIKKEDGSLEVPYITGIEVKQMSEIPAKQGETDVQIPLKDKDGNTKTFDVLHIRINGVDPKAIQNFAFSVAPGNYYSSTWDKVKVGYGQEEANPYFGVEYLDTDFMDKVRSIQVPRGAGPYRATAGETSRVPGKDEKSDFYNASVVFFERNEHFMLGAPKIKKLRYQVINNNMLYESIVQGAVHYGSPSMDHEKLDKLYNVDNDKLENASAQNLGYGYIGVSAQFVPNLWVRRAIMVTLNPQECVDYYGGGENASIIRRPMSKTLKDYYDEVAFADYSDNHYYCYGSESGLGDDLEGKSGDELARIAGDKALEYAKKGGCYLGSDNILFDPVSNKPLKLTFTIAGGSDDHPAYSMLQNSVDILNSKGFDITLKQDSRALSLLASGALTVWAAAWSSSSDPDMYQVYHKDSRATSTRAWGYDYLKSSRSTQEERDILQDLANLIDDGRETTEVSERKEIYIDAQNKLMELAVEFPTYQRKVYYVWGKGLFDPDSILTGSDVGTYQSPLSRIWEVSWAK